MITDYLESLAEKCTSSNHEGGKQASYVILLTIIVPKSMIIFVILRHQRSIFMSTAIRWLITKQKKDKTVIVHMTGIWTYNFYMLLLYFCFLCGLWGITVMVTIHDSGIEMWMKLCINKSRLILQQNVCCPLFEFSCQGVFQVFFKVKVPQGKQLMPIERNEHFCWEEASLV